MFPEHQPPGQRSMTEMLPQAQSPLERSPTRDPEFGLASENQEAVKAGGLVSQGIVIFDTGPTFLFLREPVRWQEDKGGWPVHQQAFICPWCLREWARSTILQREMFQLEAVPCASCARPTASHPVPGSLLDISGTGAIDCVLLDALPEPLLRREFELTLKAFPNVHNG